MDQVHVEVPRYVAVKRDLVAVGRPARASRHALPEAGQLHGVFAVRVANPDLVVPRAAGLKRDPAPIGRYVRELVSSRALRHAFGRSANSALNRDSPKTS